MADAGDLEILPLEIRKEIYKYVLVEPKTIAIKRSINPQDRRPGEVARMNHHRKSMNRGKIWDGRKKIWYDAPPSSTSILLVNKRISQEATPVFYGSNDFVFDTARAFQDFLAWIGDSKQYIRKAAILHKGTICNNPWNAMDRSLALLTAAKGFRTFAFSRLAFCGGNSCLLIPETLAKHFVPFLKSLHEARSALGLSASILDVVQIVLPPCHCEHCGKIFQKGRQVKCCGRPGEPHKDYRGRMVPVCMDFRPEADTRPCGCLCETAEETNRRSMGEMREVFAEELGLDMNDERYAEKT